MQEEEFLQLMKELVTDKSEFEIEPDWSETGVPICTTLCHAFSERVLPEGVCRLQAKKVTPGEICVPIVEQITQELINSSEETKHMEKQIAELMKKAKDLENQMQNLSERIDKALDKRKN